MWGEFSFGRSLKQHLARRPREFANPQGASREKKRGVRWPVEENVSRDRRAGSGNLGSVDAVWSQLICILALSLHHEALRGRLSHL